MNMIQNRIWFTSSEDSNSSDDNFVPWALLTTLASWNNYKTKIVQLHNVAKVVDELIYVNLA